MVHQGINIQKKCQLQQIVTKSSLLQTADERRHFLSLCGLESSCGSVQLDQPSDKFFISLWSTLSKAYTTVDNSEKLALVVFLEHISRLDSSLHEEDKEFIQDIITKYEPRQQGSNSIVDEESNNIIVELYDIINTLKQDILKVGLNNVYNLGFKDIIYTALEHITSKIKKLFFADRITIYFLNESEKLSSIIADGSKSLEIQVRLGEGFAGKVAKDKKAKRSDRVECDSSSETKKQYKRTGYLTYNLLTYPLLDSKQKDLVAVIQLVNKLKYLDNSGVRFAKRIDEYGFTEKDEERLTQFATKIRPILKEFQGFYKITQKFQEVIRFTQAMQNLSQKCHDLEETRQMVMRVAREFMGADRTTLWLINRQTTELWATFPSKNESLQEKLVPVGEGYVGKAAETHQFINIPFDIYDDPGSGKSKETDRETGYRTCSLMCMPILSLDQELIGVLQLINKMKPGVPVKYEPQEDLEKNPPECFQDSFTQEDEKRMQELNNHIATAILETRKSSVEKEDDKLYKMLDDITEIVRDRLYADRATIFLLDQEKQEFWSIIKDEQETPLEIRVPVGKGIVGEVAKTQKIVNVKDTYNDPRSDVAKEKDKETGYHTYNILAIPLVNKQKKLLAVVEFINKLKFARYRHRPHNLSERIDNRGFSETDPKIFDDYYPIILNFIEGFRDLHAATRRQQRESKLQEAIRLVIYSQSDSNNVVFTQVRDAAKKLVNADRGTLWILNRESNELWAEIPDKNGNQTRQTVPLGKGYVGKAAETCEFLNIPFDLYDEPASQTSREFDQKNGYRTCSLICMPIRNSDSDLVGVIQLVNKRRPGSFPKYDPKDWPNAPECFQASFTEEDINILNAFNSAAGTRLYKIELFDEIRQKAKQLIDDLHGGNEISLS
ncbi:GAF domain-containing protein [Coleofasciculus sp.]|uniref:GAF domain-containing protein n=1 Tax=Coleofasciculus sp. TaxID=3100458 RepID=UPI0039F79AD7